MLRYGCVRCSRPHRERRSEHRLSVGAKCIIDDTFCKYPNLLDILTFEKLVYSTDELNFRMRELETEPAGARRIAALWGMVVCRLAC